MSRTQMERTDNHSKSCSSKFDGTTRNDRAVHHTPNSNKKTIVIYKNSKRLHYPTRSMQVDWYKARNSKWFILAKPGWKWNIWSPRTLNKLVRTITLPEHKPAQAQGKGRYIFVYAIHRPLSQIQRDCRHQFQTWASTPGIFCIHKYVTGKQTIPFKKWHRKGSSKPQGSSRGEMHYVLSVQLLIPYSKLNNEIA